MKHTHTLLALAALFVLGCRGGGASPKPATTLPSPEDTRGEQFRVNENLPPKFFSSATGLEVEIVYLEDGSNGESRALCRIKGSPHPVVGVSLLLKGKVVGQHYLWKILYNGRLRSFMGTEKKAPSLKRAPQVVLRLPRAKTDIDLEYNRERSQDIDPQELIALHKKHADDGTIAALEELDRDYYISKATKTKKWAAKRFQEHCGRIVPIEIDWDSVFAANRQRMNTCDSVFRTAASICNRDYDSKRIFNRDVKRVVCGSGDTNKVALGPDGTLAVQLSAAPLSDRALYLDIKKVLSLTAVVGQGDDGRIVVIDPDAKIKEVFIGDGKVLYKISSSPSSSGLLWSTRSNGTSFKLNEAGIEFKCSTSHSVVYKPVSDARRLEILQNAKYEPPLWRRKPFGLARDDQGIYYYVDHLRKDLGGKDFRVFIGPRGNAKATPLIDVVDDSNGKIFATKSGKLRLILSYDRPYKHSVEKGTWISKKKRRELVVLPIASNRELIYHELGAYDADYFGTPCE